MSKKGFGKLLAGLGIGFSLGMLVSPASGKENREALKKGAKKVADKVKNIDLDELKETLVNEYDKLVEQLKDMDMEKAKKIAAKKGRELTDKANELIELAKEKSAPVVEKAAKQVKKNLADLLASTAEKLND